MFRWSKKKKHAAETEYGVESDGVTQQFTINLPKGKKKVVRANPLMTLGDLVISVLKDKGYDPDLEKYVLGLPKHPGFILDPKIKLHEFGDPEVNVVSLAHQDRNHTMSMPDLSRLPPSGNQPPSFSPPSGQSHKKKRGFLSFLSKKDKKFKTELNRSFDSSINSNFSTSTPPAQRTPLHDIQRRSSDQTHKPRPQSMFVSSNTPSTENVSPEQGLPPIPPSRKKRRAPEPPILEDAPISDSPPNSFLEVSILINNNGERNTSEVQIPNKSSQLEESYVLSQEKEMPRDQHSCNSLDLSGYHNLSPSRLGSPEYSKTKDIKTSDVRTSVDVTSLGNTDSTSPESIDAALMNSRANEYHCNKELVNKENHRSEVAVEPVAASSSLPDEKFPGKSETLCSNQTLSSSSTTTFTITSTSSSDFVKVTTAISTSPTQTNLIYSHTNVQTRPVIHDNFESTEVTDKQMSDLEDGKNEPTNIDINDILDGVVFDEEPWLSNLMLAKKAGVELAEQDPMMMVETASVNSENIDQIENLAYSHRPCAFIPPPPPSEPPPPEDQPVGDEPYDGTLVSTTALIFVDKGTEVNDDNSSLATSSTKSSPGRVSSVSMHEMALFVDTLGSMTLNSQTEQDDELIKPTVSSPHISSSIKNMDGHDTMWPPQTTSRDSSFEAVPHTVRNNQKVKGIDLSSNISEYLDNLQNKATDESSLSGKISKPLTDLMHSELDVKDVISQEDKSNKNVNEGDDDEEYYTETIEELIIPYGPNGYDFAAARRKEDTEIVTVQIKSYLKDTEKSESRDLFSSKQDFNVQLSSTGSSTNQSQPKTAESKPQFQHSENRDVLLSTEDVSNGNFLPLKSEIAKTSVESQIGAHESSKYVESLHDRSPEKTTDHMTNSFLDTSQSTTSVKNTDHSKVYNKSTEQPEESFKTVQQTAKSIKTNAFKHQNDNTQPETAKKGIVHHFHAQNAAPTEEKQTNLTKLPNMRASAHINSSYVFPDDELSDSFDPILVKSRPHLLMNSHNNLVHKPMVHQATNSSQPTSGAKHQKSFSHGVGSDAVSYVDQPGSRTSTYNAESQEQQEVLQREYYALQAQFQQWQGQLAVNQSLLASQAVGSDFQADNLQQQTEQMVMQKQMMQQLQATMLALQQQQHISAGQEHEAMLAELPVRIHQPVSGAAEPATLALTRSHPQASLQKPAVTKARSTTGRKPRKFERELSPREQLMIAIKTFSKGELKSVPIEKTRWTSRAW